VPCLYRRAAFAAIDLDNPRDYYRNVFTRFDDLSPNERADVTALTSFARRVKSMTPVQRMATAVSHGACDLGMLREIGPDVDDPYSAWADMLERWATEFLGTARAWASRDVRRRLSL
jgi:hypothetical protein